MSIKANLLGSCRHWAGGTMRIVAVLGAVFLLNGPVLASAATPSANTARARSFSAAAQEFGVPEDLLLAVSYNESRLESHGAQRSSDNGFGLMNLRSKVVVNPEDGRGDPARPMPQQITNSLTNDSLQEAADLLKVSPDDLKKDDNQNIRGGAAVLAKYAREADGQLPTSPAGWYTAVTKYSGSPKGDTAKDYAQYVYQTLEKGADVTTLDGQKLKIKAQKDIQNQVENQVPKGGASPRLDAQSLSEKTKQPVDCPTTVKCRFVPAAYQPNSDAIDDYGSYAKANRPQDMRIDTIVIHNTEGSYQSAINRFQDPTQYVSAHYVIRSSDGEITEMVHPDDVAWTAGDWYVNMHSINIEHEGVAAEGAKWYSESMYRSSAELVRYLAEKYNITISRQNIIGHDETPSLTTKGLREQHWDPGPYWDWNHYMDLIRGIDDPSKPGSLARVTPKTKSLYMNPDFVTNQPAMTNCTDLEKGCVKQPAQGANRVYLRTGPENNAPFLSDPVMHPDGKPASAEITDWSAFAASRQRYAVAGVKGDWTAIWFGGQRGWFYNPTDKPVAVANDIHTVTPKAGKTSIPVYGAATPNLSDFPEEVQAYKDLSTIEKLYDMPAGQTYTAIGRKPVTDYFYIRRYDASEPFDHTIFVSKNGQPEYIQISYNHRVGFVKAADVEFNKL